MITKEFSEAIDAQDFLLVRIMLKDSLLVDPTFAEFDEMIDFAESKLEIYEVHDGEELNKNPDSWTEDYMNEQLVQLVNNFSRERIELLKHICGFLFAEKAKQIKKERVETKPKKKIPQKEIGVGLTVAGAAATVVGVVTTHTAITVAGVTAAVVGGILIATDK